MESKMIKIILVMIMPLWLSSCDGYCVKGTIKFDETGLPEITSAKPKFWLRNEDKNVAVTAKFKYENGLLRIYGLPAGNYGMSIDVDANVVNPAMYPGDYRGWTQFNVTEGNRTYLDIELSKIIQLTSPQDNGTVMEYWDAECNDKILLADPVVFSWKPLGSDVYYDYHIQKMSCNPYKTLDTITGATTQGTSVSVPLPSSAPDEFYQFHLAARKNGKTIGTLMTHGGNGYGWDYRFRIK